MNEFDVCITCFRHDVIISISRQPREWRDWVNEDEYHVRYLCPSGCATIIRDVGVPEIRPGVIFTFGTHHTNMYARDREFDSHEEALRIQRDAYAALLCASRRYGVNMRVIYGSAQQEVAQYYARVNTERYQEPLR